MNWGAAFTLLMGPLGMLISLVQSFRKNWGLMVSAFKDGGILEGIKAIGRILLEAVVAPVRQLIELINRIPGINIPTRGILAPDGGGEFSTTRATAARESISREEKTTTNKSELVITDNTSDKFNVFAPQAAGISLGSTNAN